ncbi:MAG: calcium:proton antiporter [Verrucomicrobiota bacterium]
MTPSPRSGSLLHEWPLIVALGVLGVLLAAPTAVAPLLGSSLLLVLFLLLLCGVILAEAVAIVRHAEALAHRLGEPFGTLLLTLAITGLEVLMVAFVMSTGDPKPALARDTMYSVVMLVLNGFFGLALLLGALRHSQQRFNLQSANSFLVMIVPMTVLALVLPTFTRSTAGPTLSHFQMAFLSLLSIGIYGVFLVFQNRLHREFFIQAEEGASGQGHPEPPTASGSPWRHGVFLVLYGITLVLLAKQMAKPLDLLVGRVGAPNAVGGLVMAILVLTPESIAAIRAAWSNELQRSVNILLGSVLASIGLTVPIVIGVSLSTGRELLMGLDSPEIVMLALTLVTSMLTLSLPRTNLLLGAVHLLLFGAFLMLVFD